MDANITYANENGGSGMYRNFNAFIRNKNTIYVNS